MSIKPTNIPKCHLRKSADSAGNISRHCKLGELTENIRTFALPFENQTYTFKMQYEYDSWNRIQKMTYPDGEVVTYGYNLGGLLERVSGRAVRQNVAVVHPDPERSGGQTPTPEPTVAYNYPYIDSIAYNKFEQKDTVWYGNGTRACYAYDSLQRLLHLRSYEGHDSLMQDIAYTYDAVGNITDIDNAAGMLSNGLGGKYHDFHEYDNLYRLTYSSGDWFGVHPVDYKTVLEYLPNGRIGRKLVEAQTYRQTVYGNSTGNTLYDNRYHYNTTGQQNTLSYIDGGPYQEFRWDSMGNMTYHRNAAMALERHLCWDEQNRLQGVRDDGHLSFYLYDANGDRTCKFTGEYTVQNQTGRWQHFYQMGNATLYASPYLVANRQGYTKHYYAESERVASRIGGGGLADLDWNTAYHRVNGAWDNAMGQVRSGHRLLPSLPSNLLRGLSDWQDSVQPEMDCYWYHPDHLGSASWVTDADGSAVQHLEYLPWGEDLVDQRSTGWNAMYTFSAKEKDAETGYSYFGSRYYNSDLSIWLSVDPMAGKYPSMSPYVYCANNPVKLVDPNGEAWEVNQDGYIRQCGDENDHTLYAVKGRKDEFGDRILYKYGKLKGKERSTPVSVDVMSKMISDKTQHWDVMSRRYIEHDYTKLEFIGNRGIDEAKKLICFLSKNTDVEWSIVGGSYQKDISTLICTSHFEKKEYMGADRAALMAPFNNLYFFFHTHPKNEIFGWLSNEKDRAVCRALACDYNSPQALFGVIHKGVFFDLHGTRILKRNVW